MNILQDKILGCIVGGAIGDYIGSLYEGKSGPIEVLLPLESHLTDDTQLTLATCEAIVKKGDIDPESIGKSFSEWFSQRKISGIGSSTFKALRDLSVGAHWYIAGATGEMSQGNGAAMRIAPLAFCIDPICSSGRKLIKDVASITHRHEEAISGALAVTIAISTAGYDYISTILDNLYDSKVRDRVEQLSSSSGLSITEIGLRFGSGGYVVESVPLALIAASRAKETGFQDAIYSVISCGGDTDTTGSMVGQIVGSKVGLSGISDELKSMILGNHTVMTIANEFAEFIDDKKCRTKRFS